MALTFSSAEQSRVFIEEGIEIIKEHGAEGYKRVMEQLDAHMLQGPDCVRESAVAKQEIDRIVAEEKLLAGEKQQEIEDREACRYGGPFGSIELTVRGDNEAAWYELWERHNRVFVSAEGLKPAQAGINEALKLYSDANIRRAFLCLLVDFARAIETESDAAPGDEAANRIAGLKLACDIVKERLRKDHNVALLELPAVEKENDR